MNNLASLILLTFVSLGLLGLTCWALLWIWTKREYELWEPNFLQELVVRRVLTHGPPTLPQALDCSLGLTISNPFGGPWGWPKRPPAIYDWSQDA
jgi:hypothetical protein